MVAALAGAGFVLAGTSFGHVFGNGNRGGSAPPTLYIAATGSDSNACTATAPCLTFKRAFQVAPPGAVVVIGPGTYAEQSIEGTNPGNPVVFEPAPGAAVDVQWVEVHATNVELRDLRVGGWTAWAETDGFTARNISAANFEIFGASNVRVLGGDYGPSYNPGGKTLVNYIAYGGTDTAPVNPRNIVIDGAYIHDVRRGGPENHNECMFVNGGDGITIRDSRFQRCDVFDIFFTQSPYGPAPTNILLENNFFDRATADGGYDECCTYYAVRFSDQIPLLQNVVIRYNSALQTLNVGTANNVNVSMIGNVAPRQQSECVDNITFSHNVWDNARCSPTDRRAPSGFLNPAMLQLYPKPHSRAIDAGDPKDFPRRDINGTRRPLGKLPDAGAVETR